MLDLLSGVTGRRFARWASVLLVALAGLVQASPGNATTQPDPESSPVSFPKGVPLPLKVGVSVFVKRIDEINEKNNTFVGLIDVRYRWRDPRLAFSVKEMASDRLEFDNDDAQARLQTMWSPRITITNMLETDARKQIGLLIYPDGSVDLIQRIKATFETHFDLWPFPFDAQTLPVLTVSSKYHTTQIKLFQEQRDLDHSGLNPGLKLTNWIPQGLTFRTSQERALSGEVNSRLEAQLKIARGPGLILMGIFTPFLLLMAVPTILAHLKSVDLAIRLNAWAASILALVALSFAFALRYPALGGDSLISYTINTGYAYQLLSLFLTATIYNPLITDRLGNKLVVAELASYLRWAMPLLLVGTLLTSTFLRAYSW